MKIIPLTTDFSTDPIFINAEFIVYFSAHSKNRSKTRITFINGDVLLANISCDKLVDLLGLIKEIKVYKEDPRDREN